MPPVASPETICWIRMSILIGGERAPLLPQAPPPLRDSRCAVHLLVLWWLIWPASTYHRWVFGWFMGFWLGFSIRDRSGGRQRSFSAPRVVPTLRPGLAPGGRRGTRCA